MEPLLVLIHSPLVGPYTWAPVEEILRQKGARTARPALNRSPGGDQPYWRQHAQAVARSLDAIPVGQPVVLIAHSGAGPLLPAVRQAIQQPVIGYLFVDAGWPANGKSRLDQFEDAAEVEQFRQSAQAGFLPLWSDADLAPVIPNAAVRQRFVRELRPLPLAVYEEALPVFSGWPDAPCGYIRFGVNPAYDQAFAQAQAAGFPTLRMDGQHFHLLVDPNAVAEAVLNVIAQMGIWITGRQEN